MIYDVMIYLLLYSCIMWVWGGLYQEKKSTIYENTVKIPKCKLKCKMSHESL